MRGRLFISSFKVLLFCAIVGTMVLRFGSAYVAAAGENQVNLFTKQRYEEFYAQETDSLDMIFIGSSHSYCTFDPTIIDGALGTSSWQLGTPAQSPDTSYYLLREVLNYHTLDTVVMELYWDVCDDAFQQKQFDYFSLALQNEALKSEYISQVFPTNERLKYSIDVIRYQPDYFAYQSTRMANAIEEDYGVTKRSTTPANGVEYYAARGYVYCDIILPDEEYDSTNQFKYFDGADWVFNETSKGYVEDIIALCQAEDIRLIFVTAPVANVSMDYIQNYDAVHQIFSNFAAEHNIPYIDYNMVNLETPFLENENFRDDGHMNHSGVELVDAHFIQFMQSLS